MIPGYFSYVQGEVSKEYYDQQVDDLVKEIFYIAMYQEIKQMNTFYRVGINRMIDRLQVLLRPLERNLIPKQWRECFYYFYNRQLIVQMTSKPKPFVSAQSTTACSGDAFIISPTNGNGNIIPANILYSWPAPTGSNIIGYSAASDVTPISQTLTSDTNIVRVATYSVTASANGCSSSIFAVTVNVKPRPVISDKSASTCSGVAFNVIPTNGNGNIVPSDVTYFAAIPSNITNVSTLNSLSGDKLSDTLSHNENLNLVVAYNVFPTSGTCTGASCPLFVTIKPAPN